MFLQNWWQVTRYPKISNFGYPVPEISKKQTALYLINKINYRNILIFVPKLTVYVF